jgi:hypothetical protein
MGSSGLLFILTYAFGFATLLIFRRIMKDRRRIALEQESLPALVKVIRFSIISVLTVISGWGAVTGQFSADFSATIFYGGIALTTFLTNDLG